MKQRNFGEVDGNKYRRGRWQKDAYKFGKSLPEQTTHLGHATLDICADQWAKFRCGSRVAANDERPVWGRD